MTERARDLSLSPNKPVIANLGTADLLIVLLYFAAVLGIGYYGSRHKPGSEDFINASRQMPWLAVLGSLVATEVSASTFLATPGVGFSENMSFLQMGIGSFFARIFIAFCFIGAFYSFNSLTIYEYLAKRFGNRTRTTASAFFIVTRMMASAVRLMIAAKGLSIILGLPFLGCLAVFTLIAMLYTGAGGIRTIIWTDVLQAVVFISCGIVVLLFIAQQVGWSEIIAIGSENGRFEVFQLAPELEDARLGDWLNNSQLLYVALMFGFLSTAAAFGTDQDLTQRMLTSKDAKSARRSLILSGFVSIPIAALFLMVGVALFAYCQVNSPGDLPMRELATGVLEVNSDQVFPWFIGNELPIGLRGLLLVGALAAAMSSLDSAMGALGSSALVDLYRPIVPAKMRERIAEIWVTRGCVIFFGLLLGLGAWLLQNMDGFLWLTFQIGSITYGGLLGVFLLGILTRRGADTGNCLSLASGAILCACLLALMRGGFLPLAWPWLILIGTTWTFGLAALWPVTKKPRSLED